MQSQLIPASNVFVPITIRLTLHSAGEAADLIAAYHALSSDDIYAALERWQEPGVTNELRLSAADTIVTLIANLACDIKESHQWPLITPCLPPYLSA